MENHAGLNVGVFPASSSSVSSSSSNPPQKTKDEEEPENADDAESMPHATTVKTIAALLVAGKISDNSIRPPAIDDGALSTADAPLSFDDALMSIAGAMLSFDNVSLFVDRVSLSFADAPLSINNTPLTIADATSSFDNAPLPAVEMAGNEVKSPDLLDQSPFPQGFPAMNEHLIGRGDGIKRNDAKTQTRRQWRPSAKTFTSLRLCSAISQLRA